MTPRSNRIGALLFMLATAARGADAPQMIAVNPQTLKFIQIPNMPKCATAAILRGNPRSGPAWVLLKLASGCRVPFHWHTPNEEMLVISGQGTLSMKEGPRLQFVPGAYASLPSHHVPQPSCRGPCLFSNSADGTFDTNYVDADGKEISLEKAMQQQTTTRPAKKK